MEDGSVVGVFSKWTFSPPRRTLVPNYAIVRARLKPLGNGPVASNNTEEERAENCRVELVKQ
jgi:hypothetical protein